MKLYAHSQKVLTIPVGEKIAIGSYGSGVCLIEHSNAPVSNFPKFYTSTELSNGYIVLGPYDADHTIRLTAGNDDVEYVINSDPLLQSVAMPLSDQELSLLNLTSDVLVFTGDGAPVNYTDGTPPATGEGRTGKGSKYIDFTNGKEYINTGTKAEPTWTYFINATEYNAAVSTLNGLASIVLFGSGAPVDYTDGTPPATGEGTVPKGALYIDHNPAGNGYIYRNSGAAGEPIWTRLADAGA